ncbi:MAG: YgiT-type zinc finger protein [Chloroflexota bacterium]
MTSSNGTSSGFWKDEECEYCGGPLVDKHVTLYRSSKGAYFLFEHVPAGVCKECGTRYYAANILKRIEESIRGQQKAKRKVLVPVYSV